ncbi:GntR family transcriptional regulator [Caldalkalibacillus salinus]|uniref:GntR family transcriptional regulator n=1 Tax=Caldalkalibacillus salinus TaxID=2803787 RepID=UPI0019236463|nr:GntR family transcriptional regulator [Caldalkalibacillus salinus]
MQAYRTKTEMIYQTIKEEILNGEYEFGEKLVISRLAQRFNSSEIPVREAIRHLDSDNLIEFKPHTGAVVSTLSAKDIQDIFELRVELEGLATRLATEHLQEDDFNELQRMIEESKRAFELKDYEQFETLNIAFHDTIYNACDNKLLIRTIRELWSNTRRYPSLFKENDEHITQSIKEHEAIFEALVKKDSMLAESRMINHKTRAGKEVLRMTQWEFYNYLDHLLTTQEK